MSVLVLKDCPDGLDKGFGVALCGLEDLFEHGKYYLWLHRLVLLGAVIY